MSAFVGPFDIGLVVDRIKAGALGFTEVAGAAELDAAVKSSRAPTPGAFVLLAKENAERKSGGSVTHVQAVDVVFSVVLSLRNYRQDQRGTAQNPELTQAIRALRGHLVGWKPEGFQQVTSVDALGGSLVSYDQAVIWWQENFAVRYWISK
jgi:hypothetical protein